MSECSVWVLWSSTLYPTLRKEVREGLENCKVLHYILRFAMTHFTCNMETNSILWIPKLIFGIIAFGKLDNSSKGISLDLLDLVCVDDVESMPWPSSTQSTLSTVSLCHHSNSMFSCYANNNNALLWIHSYGKTNKHLETFNFSLASSQLRPQFSRANFLCLVLLSSIPQVWRKENLFHNAICMKVMETRMKKKGQSANLQMLTMLTPKIKRNFKQLLFILLIVFCCNVNYTEGEH